MTPSPHRCYYCDTKPARYVASIDHDCTPDVYLCIDCAARERDWDSVLSIRSIRTNAQAGTSS